MNARERYTLAYRLYRQVDPSCTNLDTAARVIVSLHGTIGERAIASFDCRLRGPYNKLELPDRVRILYRLGQAYERAKLSNNMPLALTYIKLLQPWSRNWQEHMIAPFTRAGQNSIRRARGLQEL